ncbi:hypothetical protein ACJQWK_09854 [Exserohilum turcicum]|uniref:Uncharacterized protein n=1 Tax=Exserohilum turcicum (strain 28A) TaxID=671987 RepID=R0I5A1_EXST2|nr:uncharacterized protein SETTUDRAFT_100449 [Exserohilum turcica Et28A]EOA80840.1 hypothetical protein SETTUDRAFT_100449 [Exserohilum turcica Et28A]
MAAPHSPPAHASQHHLPPSPPPSPPATRRRHRRKPDPFEALATTPIPSIPASPASEPAAAAANEPLLKRIILTPILFTSFLVSLFLVNYRNRARRTAARAPSFPLLTYLFPSTWLDPEPYQHPHDSTWDRRDSSRHVEPHDAISPGSASQTGGTQLRKKRTSWHLHKKIRKVARLEIGDAWEMRGRVIVAMAAIMLLTCAVLCMALKWCFLSVSHALSRA